MKIKRIGIVAYAGANKERERDCQDLASKICAWLEEKEIHVIIGVEGIKIDLKPDLICVLGGDGTFIWAVRELLYLGVPFLGVNFGTKGFLLPFEPTELFEYLEKLVRGHRPESEERTVIETWIDRGNKTLPHCYCVNEVLVKSDFRMVNLDVRENGITRIQPRADGVIVATPTGSTAYSYSAGGTPLAWDSGRFAITAIACASRIDSKWVADSRSLIEIEVLEGNPAFVPDGQVEEKIWLNKGDIVKVRMFEQTFKTLIPEGYDSYLRTKKLLG